ncbi:nucleoid-associated protein [Pseudomonas viridiflava]|uniref:nucleoid-associated protein n=1 Tax=Pseudomonas viridiflava TaxID=33069 RepID=UPI000F032A3B|nr:nucleoid-associated protein [Pseudomonas viridiflava]MCJ8176432.1 nucleoid-associated protein [Pseudomonas viridiflava]
MITLKTAIIHSFKKSAHTDLVSDVVKKDIVLDTQNPALVSLVEGINGLIGKEGNSVVYGQFAEDGRQGPFPARFSAFTDVCNDEPEFIALTHLAMDQLVEQAKEQILATGGHILCARYASGASEFFLVASIKQRGGIQLDEDYVPTAIQEVDLKTVQQAARINLLKFASVTAAALDVAPENADADAENAEEVDSTYLCFISRGRDSKASDYFISALGCAKGVASGRATKNAVDHVSRFFRNKPELKAYAYRAKEAVVRYLQDRIADGKSARLDAICHAAIQHVPPNLVDSVAGIKDYLNDEKHRVPEDFTVNAKSLREKTRIKGEAASWSLQFERGSLGQEATSDVYYDEGRKKLTLSNMSQELLDLIEKELQARVG